MTNHTELKAGTRIYYTGDMANISDFGTIASREQNRWGDFVNISLDDGRKFNPVPVISFDPSPGRRFITEREYNDNRKKQLEELQTRYRAAVQS